MRVVVRATFPKSPCSTTSPLDSLVRGHPRPPVSVRGWHFTERRNCDRFCDRSAPPNGPKRVGVGWGDGSSDLEHMRAKQSPARVCGASMNPRSGQGRNRTADTRIFSPSPYRRNLPTLHVNRQVTPGRAAFRAVVACIRLQNRRDGRRASPPDHGLFFGR